MPPSPPASPTSLYRTSALRRIEIKAADQPLMQRAGQAAANLARTLTTERNAAILILAGPGNNGGDAFVAAQALHEKFFAVHVVFLGHAKQLPPDAAEAYQKFIQAGGTTHQEIPANQAWSLIIDGLFGIGLSREIGEPYAGLIGSANALALRDDCALLALDCPSGLDADTGKLHGLAIRASHTLSFIAGKPGLFTAEGPAHCGLISIAPLGLEAITQQPLSAKQSDSGSDDRYGACITRSLFAEHLIARPLNSHKGSFGNAGIIGGAAGMVGAALLTARAALKLGSGRVYVGLLDEEAPRVDAGQAELMLRLPEQILSNTLPTLTALACGPGMGNTQTAKNLLAQAIQIASPLILDADALNLLATEDDLQVALSNRTTRNTRNTRSTRTTRTSRTTPTTPSAPTLLTPHPAEAAGLLACDVSTVQADRLTAALTLATRFNAFVALKGCGTVIATPNGHWFINTTGNPGLATAGSGDVLTGILTALLAQGWPAQAALLAAVHLHGAAADHLVAQGIGPIGLTASELIDAARFIFNQWILCATH